MSEQTISENVYSTPRTYGSPTGYDVELSHYPDSNARLAERIALHLCSGGLNSLTALQVAERAGDIASALSADWEKRGWMLPVQPAPGMNKDYGAKRGAAV